VKEPFDINVHDRRVVCLGVLGEGLGDEDAGIVHGRVDPPEPVDAGGDRMVGRLSVGDVADQTAINNRSERIKPTDFTVVPAVRASRWRK
jgi:hypothetical protein